MTGRFEKNSIIRKDRALATMTVGIISHWSVVSVEQLRKLTVQEEHHGKIHHQCFNFRKWSRLVSFTFKVAMTGDSTITEGKKLDR
jgi:hypothetical protein